MNILSYAKSVEPCQRNYDWDLPVPAEHVQYILDCASAMPTKQNIACYKIFASTNSEFNNKIFLQSFWDGDKFTHLRNGQVNAPLLLIFCQNVDNDVHLDHDLYVNIGIAMGAASLAAAELGYKTGFNKCFKAEEISALIHSVTDKEIHGDYRCPILMLGIGHPKEGRRHNDVFLGEKGKDFHYTVKAMGPKTISTFVHN